MYKNVMWINFYTYFPIIHSTFRTLKAKFS